MILVRFFNSFTTLRAEEGLYVIKKAVLPPVNVADTTRHDTTRHDTATPQKGWERRANTASGNIIHNTYSNWGVCSFRLQHCSPVYSMSVVLLFKKNMNASKPSEHPPQVEECLKV